LINGFQKKIPCIAEQNFPMPPLRLANYCTVAVRLNSPMRTVTTS